MPPGRYTNSTQKHLPGGSLVILGALVFRIKTFKAFSKVYIHIKSGRNTKTLSLNKDLSKTEYTHRSVKSSTEGKSLYTWTFAITKNFSKCTSAKFKIDSAF